MLIHLIVNVKKGGWGLHVKSRVPTAKYDEQLMVILFVIAIPATMEYRVM